MLSNTTARRGIAGLADALVPLTPLENVQRPAAWVAALQPWTVTNAAAERLLPVRGAETCHMAVLNRYRNSEGLVAAAFSGLCCSPAAWATVPNTAAVPKRATWQFRIASTWQFRYVSVPHTNNEYGYGTCLEMSHTCGDLDDQSLAHPDFHSLVHQLFPSLVHP